MSKAENTEYLYKLKKGLTHHEMAYTEEGKDIGVVIDGKFDFEKHIHVKINKASSTRAHGDMIETCKLLHDKYNGEYSQLVKLHANQISREGTRGTALSCVRSIQS